MSFSVLHLSSEKSWRGGENQMRLLAEGLQARGIQCHFALRPESMAFEKLAPQFPHLCVSFAIGSFLGSAIKIARYCKAHNIQVIDAHSSKSHSMAIWVKKLNPKLKLVVHRRVDYPPKDSWRVRKKYFSNAIDRYVPISKAIGDILVEFGVSKSKISPVYSAVDCKPYENLDKQSSRAFWLEKLGFRSNHKFALCAAALSEQKAIDTLLDALAKIPPSERQNFSVLIAGSGPLESQLKEKHRELELGDFCKFLGFIEDIRTLISASDLFILSSRDEGLGTVLLEAALAETCILATAAGGIPEIVRSHETGYLIPKENPAELSTALLRAIYSTTENLRLAKNAKRHVLENFSLSAMVEGNVRVYQELVNNG